MVSNVVGYGEEYGKMDNYDAYNKTPKFCSRCGRELDIINKDSEYNIYTGEPVKFSYLACRTLNGLHDIWKREGHGAWVNYAQKGV